MCLNGEAIEFTCPEDLYFNPKLNVCDDPENVDCEILSTSEPDTTTSEPETTSEAEQETTTEVEQDTTTEVEEDTTTEVEQETTTESEPETTTRIPTTTTETEPETTTPREPETTTAGGSQPVCPEEGDIYYPDPEDCGKFYECVNGEIYEFICPEGLHFNPSINLCDFPQSAGCQE